LPRGHHAPRRRRRLMPLSGQRAARPDSSPRPRHPSPDRLVCAAVAPAACLAHAACLPTAHLARTAVPTAAVRSRRRSGPSPPRAARSSPSRRAAVSAPVSRRSPPSPVRRRHAAIGSPSSAASRHAPRVSKFKLEIPLAWQGCAPPCHDILLGLGLLFPVG
jgi:hypothetical protein